MLNGNGKIVDDVSDEVSFYSAFYYAVRHCCFDYE
jgi:hypothetical protein